MATSTHKRLPAPVRRRHILDAARGVFLQHGLAGARTRQIAEEAGVDERLLYHYFPSKEAIYEAAVVEPLEQMIGSLVGLWETASADADNAEVQAIAGFRAVLSTMVDVLPSLGMILFSDEEIATRFYRDHLYPLVERGDEVASDLVERKTGKPLDGVVVHMVFGSCMSLALDAWLRKVPLDVDGLADRLGRITFSGVMATATEENR